MNLKMSQVPCHLTWGQRAVPCNYGIITICSTWHIFLPYPQAAASAFRGSKAGLWLRSCLDWNQATLLTQVSDLTLNLPPHKLMAKD